MKHKLLPLEPTGLKFANDEPNKFSGYASVFNGLDAYGDMIEPGAYANTIKERGNRPIRMRWNHFGPVIGKWTVIEEDEYGLRVEGELTPGHSIANDAAASLKHGAVNGLSIGYRVLDAEQRGEARLLKEIELIEISVVEEPADEMALVSGFKSHIKDAGSVKEIEGLLRDAWGLSRGDAVALVSRIKALVQSDSDPKSDDINQLKTLLLNRQI